MSDNNTSKEKKVSVTRYLQFDGKEVPLNLVEESIYEDYDSLKKGEDKPEDIKIYLKVEDGKAYYVVNGDFTGEVPFRPKE